MKPSRWVVRSLFTAIAAAALPVHATGTLTYDGPGYYIDVEVGDDAAPGVASVTVTPPGKPAVTMPQRTCSVVEFDPAREMLVLTCRAVPHATRAFTLSVVHTRATLRIGRTTYRWSRFQWVL